jgi:hypothetical protein
MDKEAGDKDQTTVCFAMMTFLFPDLFEAINPPVEFHSGVESRNLC